MKRSIKICIGLVAACLIILLIYVGTVMVQERPINQFKQYLKENGYSCSKDICSMQSNMEDGDITEIYQETYNLKEHTFTAVFIHDDHSQEMTMEMEYIYHYAEDTVTVNQYSTAQARAERKPDTIYLLNREEMLECVYGDVSAEETALYNTIFQFKKVLEKHLEESGVTLQDIIG